MSYESIDALQNILTRDIFNYAKNPKKAAGRALGTLVEIINFYILKSWGFGNSVVIESSIPEYGNPKITHNVEFALHPKKRVRNIQLKNSELPLTAKKIARTIKSTLNIKNTQLLSKSKLLRNSCVVCEDDKNIIIAQVGNKEGDLWNVSVIELYNMPFSIFECKRVGVEEGIKKGPQTIEKAKQGAYVARTISALQKIRMGDGSVYGVLQSPNDKLRYKPYSAFLKHIINSNDVFLLKDFILTVGIVSNHGNWFTSKNPNKELKVLAQSYDWLLFLTDKGLAAFIHDLLLDPRKKYKSVQSAFISSYGDETVGNNFTKVKISLSANQAIQDYFINNLSRIEMWFNVIAPADKNIKDLKKELGILAKKNWKEIYK